MNGKAESEEGEAGKNKPRLRGATGAHRVFMKVASGTKAAGKTADQELELNR